MKNYTTQILLPPALSTVMLQGHSPHRPQACIGFVQSSHSHNPCQLRHIYIENESCEERFEVQWIE